MPTDPKSCALNLLARREHGVEELRLKLRQRDFNEHEIAAALEDLVQEGSLSDRRFAESRVRHRAMQGKGPFLIRAELSVMNVSVDDIEEALSSYEGDWCEDAERVRAKKFGTEPPHERSAQMVQKKFLQTRGFSAIHMKILFSDEE